MTTAYSLSQLGIALPGQQLNSFELQRAAQRRLGELAAAGYTAEWAEKALRTSYNASQLAAYYSTLALAEGRPQDAFSSGLNLGAITKELEARTDDRFAAGNAALLDHEAIRNGFYSTQTQRASIPAWIPVSLAVAVGALLLLRRR